MSCHGSQALPFNAFTSMSLFKEVLFNYPYDANDNITVDKNKWNKYIENIFQYKDHFSASLIAVHKNIRISDSEWKDNGQIIASTINLVKKDYFIYILKH